MQNAFAPVLKALEQLGSLSVGKVWTMLVSPGSNLSLVSLAGALAVAVALLSLQRIQRGRRVRLAVLWRALFPKRRWLTASAKADLGFFAFNLLMFGVLFGWLILSNATVASGVTHSLGHRHPRPVSGRRAGLLGRSLSEPPRAVPVGLS
jgi:hypothetical protein